MATSKTTVDDSCPPLYDDNDNHCENETSCLTTAEEACCSPMYISSELNNRSTGIGYRQSIMGLPNVDFSKYLIPGFTLSKDRISLESTTQQYCTDARALIRLVQEQSKLPPKPLIRIHGSHEDYSYGPLEEDFDLWIDMMAFVSRPGWNYLKIVGANVNTQSTNRKPQLQKDSDNTLRGWAQCFVADESEAKRFTLTRVVSNWDTQYIEGCVRNLIASIKYNGNVSITFPVQYSRITVATPAPGPNSWLEKFTGSHQPEAAYDVVRSVWPYATGPGGTEERYCAKADEREWWETWREPIRNAMLTRRKGWITYEDWMEFCMGFRAEQPKES